DRKPVQKGFSAFLGGALEEGPLGRREYRPEIDPGLLDAAVRHSEQQMMLEPLVIVVETFGQVPREYRADGLHEPVRKIVRHEPKAGAERVEPALERKD